MFLLRFLRTTHKLQFQNFLPQGDYQWFPNAIDASYDDDCMWVDVELQTFLCFEYGPTIHSATIGWTIDTLAAYKVVGQVEAGRFRPFIGGRE